MSGYSVFSNSSGYNCCSNQSVQIEAIVDSLLIKGGVSGGNETIRFSNIVATESEVYLVKPSTTMCLTM